jgi:hypothetical protein
MFTFRNVIRMGTRMAISGMQRAGQPGPSSVPARGRIGGHCGRRRRALVTICAAATSTRAWLRVLMMDHGAAVYRHLHGVDAALHPPGNRAGGGQPTAPTAFHRRPGARARMLSSTAPVDQLTGSGRGDCRPGEQPQWQLAAGASRPLAGGRRRMQGTVSSVITARRRRRRRHRPRRGQQASRPAPRPGWPRVRRNRAARLGRKGGTAGRFLFWIHDTPEVELAGRSRHDEGGCARNNRWPRPSRGPPPRACYRSRDGALGVGETSRYGQRHHIPKRARRTTLLEALCLALPATWERRRRRCWCASGDNVRNEGDEQGCCAATGHAAILATQRSRNITRASHETRLSLSRHSTTSKGLMR